MLVYPELRTIVNIHKPLHQISLENFKKYTRMTRAASPIDPRELRLSVLTTSILPQTYQDDMP